MSVGIASVAHWWVVALVVGIRAATKFLITIYALRGTKPDERAKIIQSLADLFPASAWSRARRASLADTHAHHRPLTSANQPHKRPSDQPQ